MKNEITVELGSMPSGTAQQKGEYVRGGRIHHYTKPAVEKFKTIIISQIRPKAPESPCTGPVKMEMIFFYDVKDKRLWGRYKPTRPDVDNAAKLWLDCFTQAGYWKDDSVIVDLRIIKGYCAPGKAKVCIKWEELTS